MFSPAQSIIYFVEDQPVGIISVISKHFYAGFLKVFLYGCGTGSTPALTVLALTDNVHSLLNDNTYKICQFFNFGEISFV